MSKRSELRAINRAKKQGINLITLSERIEAQKSQEQIAHDECVKEYQNNLITKSMRHYTHQRLDLKYFLSSVITNGEVVKSAKYFSTSINHRNHRCYSSDLIPFKIEHTINELFSKVKDLYYNALILQDFFNQNFDGKNHIINVDINNILNISIEYFPRWGLEDCIVEVRMIFDEYNRQKPLFEKYRKMSNVFLDSKKEQGFPFYSLCNNFNQYEMALEKFYQENKKELDLL